MSDLKANMH